MRGWLFGLDLHSPRKGTEEGLEVIARVVTDDDAELGEDDVTGWFTDKREPVCLRNTHRDWGSDYDWYHPSNYDLQYADGSDAPKGTSKQVARERAAERIRQAMAEDATRRYHGVIVTVKLGVIEITSTSLWGVDTINYDDGGYFAEVADDLIDEAMRQAWKGLEELRTAVNEVLT
jgi:hypothetical protein